MDSNVCIPNIGRKGVQRRLRNGYMTFAGTALTYLCLVVSKVDPSLRMTLFAPLFLGFLYFFQAREKT